MQIGENVVHTLETTTGFIVMQVTEGNCLSGLNRV
jgi:hypothetical protein